MISGDIAYIFFWWIVWLALSLIFLPTATLLFKNFFDKGYIFSKILGILLVSYFIWLFSSAKILPFTTPSLFIALGIFLIINTIVAYKQNILQFLKPAFKMIILEELLFTAGLFFWSYVRGFEPSIHGLEKFMDFGFINSILRSEYFPPRDLWLTPLSINYYYFGHLVTAVLTKLSGIDPVITYNLMVATIFALTLAASFSIGTNFYYLFTRHQKIMPNNKLLTASGTLSAFLVTLGGNLHPIYAFFQNYVPAENPVPFWQLPFKFNLDGYWYPNATRFIQNTIHEFPIYSFVVSDLHGHVLNIPFVLLIIALFLIIFSKPVLHITHYILLALLIATSLMTNVLDGPIYILGTFLILLAKKLLPQEKHSSSPAFWEAIKDTAIILLISIVLSLPFWVAFKPFASGIGVLCAPSFLTDLGKLGPFLFEPNHCDRSPLWMLLILWGFFLFVVFGFLLFVLKLLKAPRSLKLLNLTDLLALTLAIFSIILIIIPEFVYAKDIYPAHYRANTVFKFGYQAFIILGLISGYMIVRLFQAAKRSLPFILYSLFFILLFFLVAIYPFFAINSYYGNLKSYQGLDGLIYLGKLYPTDYQSILWIRDNIKGQPVILEAQGDSYTDYARVSANTGLPTVIGWPVHEWLWRGSYDEAGKRSAEVGTIYESEDENLTQFLLQKYEIRYVFVGSLEKQKYLKLNETKFAKLGKVIYQNQGTKIYQITAF